ncbi:MAG: hypothetical protein ACR2LA_06550 [Acidimicrobiales bacterium]
MDIAWIAPPAVLLAGAGATAVLCRRLAVAVSEARTAERRLRRLEQGLIPVRIESRRLGATVDRMRRR